MKRAWLNLRHQQSERAHAFCEGLSRIGYSAELALTMRPGDGDILVTWSRIGLGDMAANEFQRRALPVLVVENASWGNGFAGTKWLTMARDFHNTAGCFPVGDSDRWDALGVDLKPWRTDGETVLLPQRGIGCVQTAMPRAWTQSALQKYPHARVRPHPGRSKDARPLSEDLARCAQVVTWGSGAAVQALMLGIKVHSDMPNWIGEQNNTDEGRLAMFRRLAWAQWRTSEIVSGEAFKRLLA